ncbi:uncharacterized protein LOC120665980 isoform X2 [Panicum virgatum]|uniref:uncharacterized protein LOC120665980 isoform X2 n=1 Tax=Panicum virgatum TaxID=38727 RepID=UPI0019D583E3|nr:uncharacterized protein LOC120665980 isoform X2 [Panicum virgatum]
MSYLFKSRSETPLTPASSQEQLAKINEVRGLLGNLPMEMPKFLSDATIRRSLRARNWSTVQAAKSLKEAASWRRQYKPEKICWIIKHFLEQKMNEKVKFVYNNNSESQRIMGDMFDLGKLESTFGGRNTAGLDINKYAEKMRRQDQIRGAWTQANGNTCSP